MNKRIISVVLACSILLQNTQLAVFAQESSSLPYDNSTADVSDNVDITSIVIANRMTGAEIRAQRKFTYAQGHGFAAERGNNLIDKIKGSNAIVIGDNNVKNGADRIIIQKTGETIFIQDKYYNTASASINACFDDNGTFRYFDSDSKPMQIEVPKDQYDKAVGLMKEKIKNGSVPGITDPDEAERIVRKGNLTYKQAVNIAKAGNIDSLKYDAANGIVSSSAAFGIDTLLNFAVRVNSGEEYSDAIKDSALDGLKAGGMQFATSVIAGQLAKTNAKNVFKPSAEALVEALGDDFAKALTKTMEKELIEEGAESLGKTAVKKAAVELISSNALVDTVSLVVFTVPDGVKLFNGKISKKQFIKNFAVAGVSTVAGAAGGYAGAVVGNLIVPGVGTIPGTIIGGVLAGGGASLAADALADYITDDDADEMYEIIQNKFADKCEEYIVTEDEANNIAKGLSKKLDEDLFEKMYQSEDRSKFADDLLDPLFEKEVKKRPKVEMPTEDEMRASLLEELDGVVFLH